MPLRFGTGLTVRRLGDFPEWLAVAEDCGFELLTTGDSQSLWADPYAAMAMASTLTQRARLAITVTNPVTRHPAVAASAAAAIQQMSGGRFVLGVGSGDSALRNLGRAAATTDEVGAYVQAVAGLTAGVTVDWHGEPLALHWLDDDCIRVPVWMAAEGPRTQRLAGRIADGVVLTNCLTEDAIELARANLTVGAAEAGRSIDDLEVWHTAHLVLAPTEDEGIDSISHAIAGLANHVYRFTLDGKGLPEEHRERVRGLQSEYDARHHAEAERGAAAANAALLDKYGLRDYLARRSAIAGPPAQCIDRLHEVAAAGVGNLILSQFTTDRVRWMRTVTEQVLTPFR